MGDVFVAHDRKLSGDVALKVLPSELARSDDGQQEGLAPFPPGCASVYEFHSSSTAFSAF